MTPEQRRRQNAEYCRQLHDAVYEPERLKREQITRTRIRNQRIKQQTKENTMDIQIIKDNVSEIESKTHNINDLIKMYDNIEYASRNLKEMYEQIRDDEAQGQELEQKQKLMEALNNLNQGQK